MAATNTPSPETKPNIDPITGLPIVPPGAVSGAPAPANPPPVAPVASASTAPAPVTPGNNPLVAPALPTIAPIQMDMGASNESKERIDAGRNASQEKMQQDRLNARKPIRLGIGGAEITDANPLGYAGGSPFGSPMRFSTPAERQAKIDANNEGKSALPTREAFMAAPRRQGTVSERTISRNNPHAPNPRTRKGVGETSLADLDRQELSLQWLANNPGIDQHERYMSAPGDTYGAALMAAKRAADPRDITPIEYPAGQTSPSLPEVDEGQTSTEGSREAMRRLYSGTPYRPDGAFGGPPTPAPKPATKKKR